MIPGLIIASGWFLTLMAWIWIALILTKSLTGWFIHSTGEGSSGFGINGLAEAPVNWVRRMVPTVYRSVDIAPWLTILLLMLFKTFVFRAMVYWGILNHPLVG